MIFFFILKIICQIYLVLPMHYYLHLNCMHRQLLTTWSEGSIEGYMQRPLTFLKYWAPFKKWDSAWYINQHMYNNWDITAPSANCPEVTFVCWLYTRGGGQRLMFKMAGTAVVLQLISYFFCCGKSLGKADSEPKRFTSARLVVLVTKTNSLKQFARHEGRAKCTCYIIQPSVLAVPLDTFSHFSVRSFHPVWQHSPVWLSIERDVDRRGD